MSISLVAGFAAAAATFSEGLRQSSSAISYEEFRRTTGVKRDHTDELGYAARSALFEKRRLEVIAHNAKPGISWTAALTAFADFSDAEYAALLGHRPSMRHGITPPVQAMSLMQTHGETAVEVDWAQKLKKSITPKDQGSCGSCWAVAAAGALETRAEQAGLHTEVSYEEMVDCVQNARQCGGTGGCKGATSELAFDYVKKHGVVLKQDYKGYQSGSGEGACHRGESASALNIQSWNRLPTNDLASLLQSVTEGPVVVSVDASPWSLYSGGVFDGCKQDATLNHAVLMVGYGKDEALGKNFFKIRNSWGERWGENGHIRLLRHTADKGDEGFCGTDKDSHAGVACKGDPDTQPVCGMCGVLADSSYPAGVSMAK